MRYDRPEQFATSGVPLVFDRFGMIGPFVADVIDPLRAARGIFLGLAAGLSMWATLVVLVV